MWCFVFGDDLCIGGVYDCELYEIVGVVFGVGV